MKQELGQGTITVTKPIKEDSGLYQCFAENPLGIATSDSISVQIFTPTALSEELKTINASEGAPLTLRCQAPEEWPNPTIDWIKRNNTKENITILSETEVDNQSNDFPITNRLTVDPTGNLHFTNVTHADESNESHYACVVTSKFIEIHLVLSRYALTVISGNSSQPNQYPATLQYVSNQHEVRQLGESIEMFCIFGGIPIPEVIWKKDGATMVTPRN